MHTEEPRGVGSTGPFRKWVGEFIHEYVAVLVGEVGAMALTFLPSVLGVAVPQWAWGVAAAVGVLPAAYRVWLKEHKKAEALSAPLALRARLHWVQDPAYQMQHGKFSLVVHNDGPGAAEQVQVVLTDIQPRPKTTNFRVDFPLVMGFDPEHAISSAAVAAGNGKHINEKQTQLFYVAWVWYPDDQSGIITGLSGYRDRGDGYVSATRTVMGPGERWNLHLTISAANAKPQNVIITLENDGTEVKMMLGPKAIR